MTTVQRASQIGGWGFIGTGLLALWYARGGLAAAPGRATLMLHAFPVNLASALLYLGLGVWGLLAARSWAGARAYGLAAGGLCILLAALGLLTPALLGILPLWGNDVWLHAALGTALAAAGLTARPIPLPPEPGDEGSGAG